MVEVMDQIGQSERARGGGGGEPAESVIAPWIGGMVDGGAMMLLAAMLPLVTVLSVAPGCGAGKPAVAALQSPQTRASESASESREQILAEISTLLIGSFSSAAHAASDPEFVDIRLEMVRIWEGRSDVPAGTWIYVEQARADMLAKPYRQRVYHVVVRDDGRVVSTVYEISTPPTEPGAIPGASAATVWAGAWRNPERFSALSPRDLQTREGCEMILVRTAPGRFEGGTDGQRCVSTLRGAKYATSSAIITPELLETWDRGFDIDGNQVWGAVKGGYRFDRVR
jgi:CpeT protein